MSEVVELAELSLELEESDDDEEDDELLDDVEDLPRLSFL